MKLISMTAFVLKQNEVLKTYKNHDKTPLFERCVVYANFLKQPLELWMFIPCDDDGNVLEKPEMVYSDESFGLYNGVFQNKNEYIKQYQRYKERVLFEGFEHGFRIKEYKSFSIYGLVFNEEETIENLLQYKNVKFTLTKTAIKQIGL